MSKQPASKGASAAGRGKKPAKGRAAEEKREDVLQAVVSFSLPLAPPRRLHDALLIFQILADSFQDRFMPFTLERPRVSVPNAAPTRCSDYTG
jgi:translation initiation factor eIF-2B subunit epsilon